jgi:hypothetical protein
MKWIVSPVVIFCLSMSIVGCGDSGGTISEKEDPASPAKIAEQQKAAGGSGASSDPSAK